MEPFVAAQRDDASLWRRAAFDVPSGFIHEGYNTIRVRRADTSKVGWVELRVRPAPKD
jgi:hypothetical protein